MNTTTASMTPHVPSPSGIVRDALAAEGAGYSVLPIVTGPFEDPDDPRWKTPDCSTLPGKVWKPLESSPLTKDQIPSCFAGNVGIGIIGGAVSGNLVIIDFDKPKEEAKQRFAYWQQLVKEQGGADLIERIVIVDTPNGFHLYFRCEQPGTKSQKLAMRPPAVKGAKKETLIEVKAEGGYVLAPGCPASCHPTGLTYHVIANDLLNPPVFTVEQRDLLFDAARTFDESPAKKKTERNQPLDCSPGGIAAHSHGTGKPGDDFNANGLWEDLLLPAPLNLTITKRSAEATRYRRQGSVKDSAILYLDTGLLHVLTSKLPPLTQDETYNKFAAYAVLHHSGDFSAAAKDLAGKGYGKQRVKRIREKTMKSDQGCIAETSDNNSNGLNSEAALIDGSQDHIAETFSRLYSATFRYVAERSQWYRYTGTHWEEEKTCLVFDLIRKLCRKFAADEAGSIDAKRKIVKASNVADIERFCRNARGHAATITQWDTDPWLLNTPGGVVDLRTGNLAPHNPELYLTKITSVAPMEIPTPIWNKFLEHVQPESEIRAYLSRRTGYMLTGSIREHALFFDYGNGRNGKGIYTSVELAILGPYAISASIDLITETRHQNHPEEIARLHLARTVSLSETANGRRWNESRIRNFTGGDMQTGRHMRQNSFDFPPQFKLHIMGNFMPALRHVDDAIRGRIQMLNWSVFIPPEERDKQLLDKLRDEYPGILWQWIQGCLEWQRDGLKPPQAVLDTTDEYLHAEDALGRWIEEATELKPEGFTKSADLFDSWLYWCECQKEYPGTQTSLTQNLQKRGCKKANRGGRGLTGIVVKVARPTAGVRQLERADQQYDEAIVDD